MIRLLSCLALCAPLLACGGGQSVPVDNTSIVPAAAAEATVSRDRNDNSKVLLEVVRLAPPEKLTPPAALYLVWYETRSGRIAPLGRLEVTDEGSGVFTATVPLEPFRILVTGEQDTRASEPSAQTVLVTEYVDVSS